MKTPCSFNKIFLQRAWPLLGTAALTLMMVRADAANFVTKASQGSGLNWRGTIWSNPPSATAVAPTAGNTYQEIANGTGFGNNLNNTRIRNPAAAGVQTFP